MHNGKRPGRCALPFCSTVRCGGRYGWSGWTGRRRGVCRHVDSVAQKADTLSIPWYRNIERRRVMGMIMLPMDWTGTGLDWVGLSRGGEVRYSGCPRRAKQTDSAGGYDKYISIER